MQKLLHTLLFIFLFAPTENLAQHTLMSLIPTNVATHTARQSKPDPGGPVNKYKALLVFAFIL